MDKIKYCNTCKKTFDINSFFRIIKRTDFGMSCDSQGISYFVKPCKSCNECRFKSSNQRLRRNALI